MKRSITEFFRTSDQKKLKQPAISDTVVAPELHLSCAIANTSEILNSADVDADSIIVEQETKESDNESIDTCDSDIDEEDADVLGPQVEEQIYRRKVSPGPKDLSQLPSDGATQPILRCYPHHVIGKKQRRFASEWFKSYSWLEYSQSADAAFCFPCRHFHSDQNKSEVFTVIGFRAWNRATGKNPKRNTFLQHKNSDDHLTAVVMCESFKSLSGKNETVLSLIDDDHVKQVAANRHYLKTVAEVLRLTAMQDLAQRGHREGVEEPNRGNFLEILQCIANHDPIVQTKVTEGPANAKYTHHSIQNALLHIMADVVKSEIKDEILCAQYYCVIGDETKDLSKTEQMSVVVRYLYNKVIHEEFIGYTPAEALDADGLCKYICGALFDVGLEIQNCIAQSYDGASVMSGIKSGVQSRIIDIVPWAMYIHCYAHQLNLIVVDSCKSSRYAADFFAMLQEIYNFISSSYVHVKWLELQKSDYPHETPVELKKLSDTRWTAQIRACHAVMKRFPTLITLLQQISDDNNRGRAFKAESILALLDLKFVFCLHIFTDILRDMKGVSDMLQKTQLQISYAMDMINLLKVSLADKRTDDQCDTYIANAKEQCIKVGLSCSVGRSSRTRNLPARLQGDITVTEIIGRHESQSDGDESAFIRKNIYFPVIDTTLVQLNTRFSPECIAVLHGIDAFVPSSNQFLNINTATAFAKHYKANEEDLSLELRQMTRMLQRMKSEGRYPEFTSGQELLQFSNFADGYKDAFYELCRLARIACTIPITTASAERSFSSLKRIKTYLRTTMCDERLTDLAMLSIHSRRAKSIDLERVVDMFVNMYPNCRMVLK